MNHTHEIMKYLMEYSFYILSKLLNAWPSQSLNFLTRKLLPIFYSTFNQLKMILLLFFFFTLLLAAMQQALILYLSFFACFCCLYLLAPSHKSKMVDSLRISVVKLLSSRLVLLRVLTISESISPKTISSLENTEW